MFLKWVKHNPFAMLEPFWYRSMYMFVLLATLSLRMSDDVSVPASVASSGEAHDVDDDVAYSLPPSVASNDEKQHDVDDDVHMPSVASSDEQHHCDDDDEPVSEAPSLTSLPALIDSDDDIVSEAPSLTSLLSDENANMCAEDLHDVPSADECNILLSTDTVPHDIAEFYSPPRVLATAKAMGRVGNLSLDLETGWDFRCDALRTLSLQLFTALLIELVILSPPCTMFSQLQWLWNVKKMTRLVFERRMSEAKSYVNHSMDCARIQHAAGRKFVFEHPARALSWDEPAVKNMAALDGVQVVTVDQCMLGLTSMSGIPMRKRTKLMTNCHVLASRFRTVGLCDRSHKHQVIQGAEGGVRRSVWSQRYPCLMCQLLAQPV